jgi:ABC-type branched-subunit amino acid transport system ATPase component
MPLLEVRGLFRSFYGVHSSSGADLAVEPGTITGRIGPYGAGKTTLFNCIDVPRLAEVQRTRGHDLRSHARSAGWCSRAPPEASAGRAEW